MKRTEQDQAVALRRKGLTYKQIADRLNVAKTSVSRWLTDLVLTDEERQSIAKNNRIASIDAGRQVKFIWEEKRQKEKDQYDPPINEPGFMLGLGLYWGEGHKYCHSTVGLSNSDPNILKQFIKWLRSYFNVVDFRVSVLHHQSLSDEEVVSYWSKLLSIPIDSFGKSSFAISRTSMKKRRELTYGTATVIAKGKEIWKVKQRIDKSIEFFSSVAQW